MKKKDFILFLLASAALGVSASIESSVLNNFLSDTFHLSVSQRTLLEMPREFPGFMVVFVSGVLLSLGDVRIAFVANALAALGMIGMSFLAPDFKVMVAWLITYSMGLHLYMPVSNSIAMNLGDSSDMGKRLGQINGVNTAVFLISSLSIALIFKIVKVNYQAAFAAGAAAFLIAAVLIFFMTPHKSKSSVKRFIYRKEYNLFYVLSILYGARKQIFITFAPWVLIKIFNQGVTTFAVLSFVIAGAGIVFKPLVGYLIDKKGERFVLAGEAALLIVICLGYAYSKLFMESIGIGYAALYIILACYVIDQLLMAAGMARATYLKKIAVVPEDVSPTLSMGITIDHAVAMFIPWLGGLVWNAFGYEYVFLGGAIIALINLFATNKVNIVKANAYEAIAK